MIYKIKGVSGSRKVPRDSSALAPGLNLAFGDRHLLFEGGGGGGKMDDVLTVDLFCRESAYNNRAMTILKRGRWKAMVRPGTPWQSAKCWTTARAAARTSGDGAPRRRPSPDDHPTEREHVDKFKTRQPYQTRTFTKPLSHPTRIDLPLLCGKCNKNIKPPNIKTTPGFVFGSRFQKSGGGVLYFGGFIFGHKNSCRYHI